MTETKDPLMGLEGGFQTPMSDHIARAESLMAQGARMILDSLPDDPSMPSSSFARDVTRVISALLKAASRGHPVTEWQDISTAPTEGEFLAYGSYMYLGDRVPTEYVMIAERTGDKEWPFQTLAGNHRPDFFSHWMPTPPFPKQTPSPSV